MATPPRYEREPAEVAAQVAAGAWLIDVRQPHEWAAGIAAGARTVPAGDLIATLAREAVPPSQALALICARGRRSAAVAERVAAAGWPAVCSVRGGFAAWCAAGLAVEGADDGLSFEARARYARHLALPEVGTAGQRKLLAAHVLVVGAGGLGSPALLYLAAAGVGRISLVDDDRVELANLQRQIVHDTRAIGALKVESAAARLAALNPEISVHRHAQRLNAGNVDALVDAADVIIDGSDNLQTRYLLNTACLRGGKPWVYAAIEGFAGHASVFWPAGPAGPWPCYRCLFPQAPESAWAPNCAQTGVLGVLPGLLGTIQAAEAIKLILGIGSPLLGRLLHVDALTMRVRETRLPADPCCPDCGALAAGVSAADNRPSHGRDP